MEIGRTKSSNGTDEMLRINQKRFATPFGTNTIYEERFCSSIHPPYNEGLYFSNVDGLMPV